MRRRLARQLVRLLGDSSGTSIIETGLLVPMFLLLLAGTTDLAMAFSLKLRTQQATARSAEMITSAGLEALSPDVLRADAAKAAGVPVSQVTVRRWLECAGATQIVFESSCDAGQETARYVAVRVTNSYRPMFGPFLPASVATNGSISFDGASTVRVQ